MNGTASKITANLFEIERTGDTLVVVPTADLRELDYREIEAEAAEVLDLLDRMHARNVVLDFHRTDYYGSTALGFFVKLWKRVSKAGGRLAFCNVSAHEREILQITKLDHLWPICSSRDKALAAIRA